MLLDPDRWRLANRAQTVLARLPRELEGHTQAETHDCVVELACRPHATVTAAVADLRALRGILRDTLDGLGLAAAASGTHPSATWDDIAVSSIARYRRIHASMRELARREPTFALHVHVAVPDGEAAVRALDALRGDLPVLLALSANSPYWQGRDSGLASARTPIFSAFPRVGVPRRFGSYRAYVRAVERLLEAAGAPDPSFIWWDARLQPRFGTVEVRIMDAQTRLTDVAALAALVQALVRLHAGRPRAPESETPEVLAERRFLAARDGAGARWVSDRLGELLGRCRPIARALGSGAELEAVTALAASPPHARQRAVAAQRGLAGLTADLGAQFAPRALAGALV
jgi:carboxylate-amine ligase